MSLCCQSSRVRSGMCGSRSPPPTDSCNWVAIGQLRAHACTWSTRCALLLRQTDPPQLSMHVQQGEISMTGWTIQHARGWEFGTSAKQGIAPSIRATCCKKVCHVETRHAHLVGHIGVAAHQPLHGGQVGDAGGVPPEDAGAGRQLVAQPGNGVGVVGAQPLRAPAAAAAGPSGCTPASQVLHTVRSTTPVAGPALQ